MSTDRVQLPLDGIKSEACTVRQFARQILAAILVLGAFNVAVAHWARHSTPRQLLGSLDSRREIRSVFIGNSLMAAGLDEGAYAAARPVSCGGGCVLNAGLGASSPVEHLLILRRALVLHPEIEEVVYGYFDFQLTDPVTGSWSDLAGNRALSFYLEPDLAAELYAPNSNLYWLRLRLAGLLPMIVERSLVHGRVEQGRRIAAGLGLPGEAVNRFGRAADFAALEAVDRADFERRCYEFVGRTAGLSEPVRRLLRAARRAGARAVVVEMPMSQRHREQFYQTVGWRLYREAVRRLVRAENCEYLQLDDLLSESDLFVDNIHMSEKGARIFSSRLGRELGGN